MIRDTGCDEHAFMVIAGCQEKRFFLQGKNRGFTGIFTTQPVGKQSFRDSRFPAGFTIKLDTIHTCRQRPIFTCHHQPGIGGRFLHVLTAANDGSMVFIFKNEPFKILAHIIFVDQAGRYCFQACVLHIKQVQFNLFPRVVFNIHTPLPAEAFLRKAQDTQVIKTSPAASGNIRVVVYGKQAVAFGSQDRRIFKGAGSFPQVKV